MLDGSVRFIKDTISTWPFDQANGISVNYSLDMSTGVFEVTPAQGVYQALSTRSGGEMTGADAC